MQHLTFRTAISLCLFFSACKSDKNQEPPPETTSVVAKQSPALSSMVRAAHTVLDSIEALEEKKDVTCWTSFRQLDWFIAEKSYNEFATLAKITAMKELVRGLWVKAALEAGEVASTAEHFAKVADLPTIAIPEGEFEAFTNDIGLKNFTDYQKTAEHWRVVLGVLSDESYRSGGKSRLLAPDASGLQAMAEAATTLSLMILKESSVQADIDKSLTVDGKHVVAAYNKIADQLDIDRTPRPLQAAPPELINASLAPLTKRLIDGRVKALLTFNKGDKEVGADLNRVSRLPITKESVTMLRRSAQSFVHFVAAGFDPMRADNYLSDGSFASTKLGRKLFLTELQTQNVVMQLFPHEMLTNGDVLLRFEPNPGPVTGLSLEPFEIRLLDHEMNGVRDSGIHWLAMQTVWNEKPFAMDPFAAEYLSEVVSMLVTTWIRRSELLANEAGKTSIDPATLKSAMGNTFVMVPPHDLASTHWSEDRQAQRPKVMASHRSPAFKDISRVAGLPTTMPRFQSSLETMSGHVEPIAKNMQGHVEPIAKNMQGHVEPIATNMQGHVEPDTRAVQGHFDLQQIMGGGIAVGDVNSDGYPDLYLTGESLGRLYLSRPKKGAQRFEDATEAWGLPTDIDDGHGTLFFDFEGDGDLDLLVLRSDNDSQLFLQEDKTFRDATKQVGLGTHRGAHVATIFDYDRDGDLDIYIGYYGNHAANMQPGKVRSLPSLDGLNGSPNQLWRNDGGTLTEVGAQAGVANIGWTLALGAFDSDGDGDLDLYLANDFGANAMYSNQGDGTFRDVTKESGTGDRGSGMNVDVADLNYDGVWDFYVTNIDMFSKNIKVIFPRDESTINITESLTRAFQYIAGNKLYMSTAKGSYEAQESAMMEPVDRGWGWDAAFFDYDNDGDDDMYLTNGWINGSYAGNQKNQLYINQDATFYLAPATSPESFAGNTRSSAVVDIDLDGDMDIVTNNFRQPPRVLENIAPAKNRWVRIHAKAAGKNPYAVGAKIMITAGDKTIMRQVSGGRGYISQADTLITAGVGNARTVAVEILWPDGTSSKVDNLATNTSHRIAQPAPESAAPAP